jgi:hypothetical protein
MAEWRAQGREEFEAVVAKDAAEGRYIWPGWAPLEARIMEGRQVTVVPSVKDTRHQFWEVCEGCARDVIERVGYNLPLGVEELCFRLLAERPSGGKPHAPK